jgi:hypothetical protein
VNSKQFKKWLTAQGATFVPGKGGHTMEGIKKQLGLKDK